MVALRFDDVFLARRVARRRDKATKNGRPTIWRTCFSHDALHDVATRRPRMVALRFHRVRIERVTVFERVAVTLEITAAAGADEVGEGW